MNIINNNIGKSNEKPTIYYGSLFLGVMTGALAILVSACVGDASDIENLDMPKVSDIGRVQNPLYARVECYASQIDQIENVIEPLAVSMLFDVYNSIKPDNSVYKEWFGEWTDSRAAKVTRTFNDIEDNWDNWRIFCSNDDYCSSQVAYSNWMVNEDQLGVCPAYWDLPVLSVEATSSQAGSLFHELKHLQSNNNSECVFGAEPARELAKTYPDVAVSCPESYEHFVQHQYLVRIITPILMNI